MAIIWLPFAQDDINSFYLYTKMYHPLDYIEKLMLSVNGNLSTSPRLGKIYQVYNQINIHQFIYKQHRIFYFILKNQEIYILKIIHFKQDVQTILNSTLRSL